MKRVFLLLISLFALSASSQTFNGGGGTIPDGGPQAVFSINVSNLLPATIDTTFGVESVCINITHPYVGDLFIQLQAPDGSIVDLSMGNGASGNNYTNCCFNNNSSNSIFSANPPYTGSFKPQGQLGIVNNGQNPNGIWKLLILDNAQPDVGSLLNWRIVFSSNPAIAKKFISSDLPIVLINTNGLAIQDEPKIIADMGIIYNGVGQRNYLTDSLNHYNNKVGIEYRGSSSQGFPQKSFGIETLDSLGIQNNVSLLGMPSEHDWILYAPYNDKTFCRNVLAYDLSRKMGHYAARTQFCELLVNGQYQGVYVLMEKIKKDSHRVNIATLDSMDIAGDALTGGYILKIDKLTGNGGQGWTSNYMPVNHPNNQTIYFQYEYPDPSKILIQQESYIQSYVDSFEYALNSIALSDTVNGYRHFMDVPSFIDFFIINELSRNVDGYRLSTYLFKNKESNGGKLRAGPVWDFNIAFKNANYCNGSSISGWAYDFGSVCSTDPYQMPFWWEKMMQDSYFKNELKCRWQSLRGSFLNSLYIHSFIDSIALLTAEARLRHYDLWPILGIYVWPNPSPIPSSYAGEISVLKNFISSRINWLDQYMPGICSLDNFDEVAEHSKVSISPNPMKDYFTMHYFQNNNSVVEIKILNALGQVVFLKYHEQRKAGWSDLQIHLENQIPDGIYLLLITDSNNQHTEKIVIHN